MKTLTSIGLVVSTFLGSGFSGSALAQAGSSSDQNRKPTVSKEERQEMATVHEKMAACLRSDKPITECRDEMRASCQKMMNDGCSMMKMNHQRMHHDDE